MTIESWERGLPEALRGQAIWRVQAYRLAAYAPHCATEDCDRLASSPAMAEVSGQLVRAVASVSANIAEGYGRRSRMDRILSTSTRSAPPVKRSPGTSPRAVP